jgi:hypothetical protein
VLESVRETLNESSSCHAVVVAIRASGRCRADQLCNTNRAETPACSPPTVTANCREIYPNGSPDAVVLGADRDGDGVADEVTIRLEVDQIQQQVWPGKYMTFWVFSLPGDGMLSPARLPSPTIRVQEAAAPATCVRHYQASFQGRFSQTAWSKKARSGRREAVFLFAPMIPRPDVGYWPIADISFCTANVRFRW